MTVPVEEFERHVQRARSRLDDLQSREDVASQDLLPELQLAVEELHVAHEELHVQQEHLLAAQQAVESERHRYKALFATAPAPLVLTDRDGMVLEVNRAAAQLLRLDASRLPTTSIFSHLDVADRSAARRLLLSTPEGHSATMRARLGGPGRRDVDLRLTLAEEPPAVMWLLADPGGEAGARPEREVVLVELVAQLTSALAEDVDIIDLLATLTERLCDVLDIDAAGILLAHDEQVDVAAVSGSDVKEVELVQLQVGDGPCLESLRRDEAVVVEGTAAMQAQWPTFAGACAAADLVSVAAFPLRGADGPLGTLNVFLRRRTGFAPNDLVTCEAMARVIVLALSSAQVVRDTRRQADHLRHALESRVVIEQAKGIIARDLRVDMSEAFDLLRGTARQRRTKLHQLADDIVGGWLDPGDLTGGGGPPRQDRVRT